MRTLVCILARVRIHRKHSIQLLTYQASTKVMVSITRTAAWTFSGT